jgi:transforming growth factor-beta-induced protein
MNCLTNRGSLLWSILVSLILTVASAQAGTPKLDIVETAVSAKSFNTLLAAATAAVLVETLKSPGPLTVFAPTDEALAKLPKGAVESLLKPENKDKLVAILTLHVLPGRVMAEEVVQAPKLTTVGGTDLLVTATKNSVKVDQANVVKTDIQATNGVIHVIDQVLLPKDIVKTAAVAGQFKTLLAAAKAAGLAGALSDPNATLTVFAPTDKAFAALPAGTVEDLLRPENKERLVAILKFHVLPKKVLLKQQNPATLQGQSVQLRSKGTLQVEEATVLLADIKTTNGVIHVIDQVLLPKLPEPGPARKAMSVIELAIERGVPLYNRHKPEACSAIYEVTAQSLLTGHTKALTDADRKRLRKALADIHKDHSPKKKAWTLRYALDDVYKSLRRRKMSAK